MNKVILSGNLGKDVEIRTSKSGMDVGTFSMATTKRVKGESVTAWHNIICFDKLAGLAGQYLHKGSKVLVVGEIQYREWEQDGVKKYKTEIIANEIEFLDPKKAQPKQESYTPPVANDQFSGPSYADGMRPDDDSGIPF